MTTAVLALSASVRFARGTDEVPLVASLLSGAGSLVLGAGGRLGGTLACTDGLRVAHETLQEQGYRSTAVRRRSDGGPTAVRRRSDGRLPPGRPR